MDSIGHGLSQLFVIIIILAVLAGAVIVGGIWGIVNYSATDEVATEQILKPVRIEIKETSYIEQDGTLVGNIPDTIYIYKIPKK